jgi:TatD DNase family protein
VKLVDTHCHLDDERFTGDRDAVIERARAAGVEFIMTIGTGSGPPDLEVAIRLAENYQSVYATVGVHPHDASKCESDTLARIAELLDHPKVLAVGEIGLDYHYNNCRPIQPRCSLLSSIASRARCRRDSPRSLGRTFDLLERTGPAKQAGSCIAFPVDHAVNVVSRWALLGFAGITYPKRSRVMRQPCCLSIDCCETDAPTLRQYRTVATKRTGICCRNHSKNRGSARSGSGKTCRADC